MGAQTYTNHYLYNTNNTYIIFSNKLKSYLWEQRILLNPKFNVHKSFNVTKHNITIRIESSKI